MEYQRKPIEGYEGLYEVDTEGNIFNRAGKKLSPLGKGLHPYCHVQLSKNGKIKNILIHRIVASAFIPNPEHLPQVNHKDGNKQNNCVENLEWVTLSQNAQHYLNVLYVDKREAKPIYGYDAKTGELKEKIEDFRTLKKHPVYKKSHKRIEAIANKEFEYTYGKGDRAIIRKTCFGLHWSWEVLTTDQVLEYLRKSEESKIIPRKPKKPIYIYDIFSGERIDICYTQSEIAEKYDPSPCRDKRGHPSTTHIYAILHKHPDSKVYLGKYYLSYENLSKEDVLSLFQNNSKPVYSYDPYTGELIKKFDSEKQVRQEILEGKSSTELYRILRGQMPTRRTLKGRVWSYEEKTPEEVVSFVLSGRAKTRKPLCCIETGEIFFSAKEAAEKYNLDYSSLCYGARGDSGTCGGLHWGYINPEEFFEKN